jgi:hypothetical protein
MKKYISVIFNICLISMIVYIVYNQKSQIKRLESKNAILTKQYDSIKSECFVAYIHQQRLEKIIDKSEEMSPDCKEEFEKMLHETE